MKESSVYQAILQEGRNEGLAEGRTTEAKRLLLLMGSKRLGEPDAQTNATLDTFRTPEPFETLMGRLLEVETWQELLVTPEAP